MKIKRKIKVTLDSGANIHSEHSRIIDDPGDLGFNSWEDWDDSTEGDRNLAVEEFWNIQGYPEIGYEDLTTKRK